MCVFQAFNSAEGVVEEITVFFDLLLAYKVPSFCESDMFDVYRIVLCTNLNICTRAKPLLYNVV